MEAGDKFSGGTAKANLIFSTGVLQRAWSSISQISSSVNRDLPFIVHDRFGSFTIVAFNDSQKETEDLGLHLPPSLYLLQSQPARAHHDQTHREFGFLITKNNSSISLHSSPLSTFLRLLDTDLKAQLERLTKTNTPLILTGRALGGSVAALCTLWLLRNQSSSSLPLCITFGSPLIGDDGLQKAVGAVEQWKAQFWHVAAHDDIIPRLFASPRAVQSSSGECKPFGTYFLFKDSGCACADDPESVLELLRLTSPSFDQPPKQLRPKDYDILLRRLETKPLRKSGNIQAAGSRETLLVDLALQLDAVGIGSDHPKHRQLLQSMNEREKEAHLGRSSTPNPSKRLSDVKKQMARLEWYKKECETTNGATYYDCYKSRSTEKDIDVIRMKNILNNYWKEKVDEAENKPQLPDARMRLRWLYGGLNYKRLVEPLDIADHYRKTDRRDYMAKRPRHYELLDKWHEEDDKKYKAVKEKKEKGTSLTYDSCFWAHVEEAALMLNDLKQGRTAVGKSEELWTKLRAFEGYVMNLVGNYELSAEVFLGNSSFMEWWVEYEKYLQPGYSSEFVAFMKDRRYVHYN